MSRVQSGSSAQWKIIQPGDPSQEVDCVPRFSPHGSSREIGEIGMITIDGFLTIEDKGRPMNSPARTGAGSQAKAPRLSMVEI